MRAHIGFPKNLSTLVLTSRWIIVSCVLVHLVLMSCRRRVPNPDFPEVSPADVTRDMGQPDPLPPDLRRCTRIEIQYLPSMLEYVLPTNTDQSLLNHEETQSLRSLKTILVEDTKQLESVAREVSSAHYCGNRYAMPVKTHPVHVVCYHYDNIGVTFTIYGRFLVTHDGHWFECPGLLWGIEQTVASEILTFALRRDCANNLWVLRTWWNPDEGRANTNFASTEWCDAIVRYCRTQVRNGDGGEYIRKYLKCPCVREAKCTYAMNPDRRPDSPGDTVLLFETRAGWNQHGGPELFTFDNHDPRGGCVLLNDGTVKFIRTKEELQQLRWK